MKVKEAEKRKVNLQDLKVQSFVTTLGNADKLRLKGGFSEADATAGCCQTLPECNYRSCVISCSQIDCSIYSFSACGNCAGGGDTGCFGSFMY